MEDLLSTNVHGLPTNFGAAFQEVIQRLEAAGVRYCLVGTLALGMYVRPRFTDEIEVLGDPDGFARTKEFLSALSGVGHADKVSIRLTAASRPEALHALANCRRLTLFGMLSRYASPLSLAWMLLEGREPYSDHDIAQLLMGELVTVDEIEQLLDRHLATEARNRLTAIRSAIGEGRYSRTYNDSVKARLARRGQ